MLLIHLAQKSWNGTSFCGRHAAEDRVCQRQVATAADDASPGKTAGPRFDTLVVRGNPAKGSG